MVDVSQEAEGLGEMTREDAAVIRRLRKCRYVS